MNAIAACLEIPLIVAPMFLVSAPSMTVAACSEGILGSFPAHSARSHEEFESWLVETKNGIERFVDQHAGSKIAPFAVNLVVHSSNPRLRGDLDLCIRHRVPIVLTSKGAPNGVVEQIHDYGGLVLHDVANQRHAEKALAAGVDGLIAVATGAGGHTGTINPFALLNEVRRIYAGPVALAGGMTTGRDILAAQAMGADFAYLGTRFIATTESLASEGHKQAILAAVATDIFFTASIDGAPANFITKSLTDSGIDLEVLRTTRPGAIVSGRETQKRWKDIWSAGQGVGNIDALLGTAELCRRLKVEYRAAATTFQSALASSTHRAMKQDNDLRGAA